MLLVTIVVIASCWLLLCGSSVLYDDVRDMQLVMRPDKSQNFALGTSS